MIITEYVCIIIHPILSTYFYQKIKNKGQNKGHFSILDKKNKLPISRKPLFVWSHLSDLNQRPSHYERH